MLRTRSLTMAALFAALLAASAWITVPLGPVPFTLQTMVVVLIALVLRPREAVLAVGAYLALGAIGVPVFSGGRAGLGVLTGPTGGYLVGFLVGVTGGAWLRARLEGPGLLSDLVTAAVTLLAAYALGTAQLAIVAGMELPQAVAVGVLPFLAFEVAKVAGAVAAAGALRRTGLVTASRPAAVC